MSDQSRMEAGRTTHAALSTLEEGQDQNLINTYS